MREQDTLGVEFANRSMILRAVHCKIKKSSLSELLRKEKPWEKHKEKEKP